MTLIFNLMAYGFLLMACSTESLKTVHGQNAETNSFPATVTPAKLNTNKVDVLTSSELTKYSYELGLDPKKDMSPDDLTKIEQRKKLRGLERSLDSQKERYNYSKVLPWLKDDEEKVEYLSIPSIEGRQVWVNKKQIWKRAKSTKDYQEIMESMDIAIGMPTDFVRKAWGEPEAIDHSGNPVYKNERWKYNKQISTPNGYRQEKRYVYFEGGRIVGWETE